MDMEVGQVLARRRGAQRMHMLILMYARAACCLRLFQRGLTNESDCSRTTAARRCVLAAARFCLALGRVW